MICPQDTTGHLQRTVLPHRTPPTIHYWTKCRQFPSCLGSDKLYTLQPLQDTKEAVYHSPNQSIQVKVFMVCVVDDTSGSMNDFQPGMQSEPHYLQQTQTDTLQLSKCSYHFLYYNSLPLGALPKWDTSQGHQHHPHISPHTTALH